MEIREPAVNAAAAVAQLWGVTSLLQGQMSSAGCWTGASGGESMPVKVLVGNCRCWRGFICYYYSPCGFAGLSGRDDLCFGQRGSSRFMSPCASLFPPENWGQAVPMVASRGPCGLACRVFCCPYWKRAPIPLRMPHKLSFGQK